MTTTGSTAPQRAAGAVLPAVARAALANVSPVPPGQTVTALDGARHPMTITAGRIDEAVTRLYNEGQCHALALALAAATGWGTAALAASECVQDPDIAACSQADIEPGLCGCQIDHLVAVRPDGALIDIEGAHFGTVRGYEDRSLVPMTEALWRDVLFSPDWRRPDLNLALSFVPPLLNCLTVSGS
jgi:hypothetical protein